MTKFVAPSLSHASLVGVNDSDDRNDCSYTDSDNTELVHSRDSNVEISINNTTEHCLIKPLFFPLNIVLLWGFKRERVAFDGAEFRPHLPPRAEFRPIERDAVSRPIP